MALLDVLPHCMEWWWLLPLAVLGRGSCLERAVEYWFRGRPLLAQSSAGSPPLLCELARLLAQQSSMHVDRATARLPGATDTLTRDLQHTPESGERIFKRKVKSSRPLKFLASCIVWLYKRGNGMTDAEDSRIISKITDLLHPNFWCCQTASNFMHKLTELIIPANFLRQHIATSIKEMSWSKMLPMCPKYFSTVLAYLDLFWNSPERSIQLRRVYTYNM